MMKKQKELQKGGGREDRSRKKEKDKTAMITELWEGFSGLE